MSDMDEERRNRGGGLRRRGKDDDVEVLLAPVALIVPYWVAHRGLGLIIVRSQAPARLSHLSGSSHSGLQRLRPSTTLLSITQTTSLPRVRG